MGWTNGITVVVKNKPEHNKRLLRNWYLLEPFPSALSEAVCFGAQQPKQNLPPCKLLLQLSEDLRHKVRTACIRRLAAASRHHPTTYEKATCKECEVYMCTINFWKKSAATSQEIQLYPEGLTETYTDIVLSRATCTVTIGDGDFPD